MPRTCKFSSTPTRPGQKTNISALVRKKYEISNLSQIDHSIFFKYRQRDLSQWNHKMLLYEQDLSCFDDARNTCIRPPGPKYFLSIRPGSKYFFFQPGTKHFLSARPGPKYFLSTRPRPKIFFFGPPWPKTFSFCPA